MTCAAGPAASAKASANSVPTSSASTTTLSSSKSRGTQIRDVFSLTPSRRSFDVVVAGPNCGPFTFLTGDDGERWAHAPPNLKYDNTPFGRAAREGWYPFYGPRLPIHSSSMLGCALVMRVRELIDRIKPRYFFIENPQGGLQTMGFMRDLPKVTVTYCQYGERRMKPTTFMGKFPPTWKPKTRCKNGDNCHLRGSPRHRRSRNNARPEE